ncbi:disulfide bond formation protein DsbB [Bacillus cereus]|uniref:Disulfide bond formation protein DsbB n=2 Tax=Bacillus cereus TaxID=1396 RepID=A0A9X6ST31_BACCE|nr:disulfide bond formation protein DsbB [Bacillus cereus]
MEVYIMKSNKSNVTFMLVVVGIILAILASLAFLTKHEEKQVASKLPTTKEYENAYKGEVKDFDYENQPVIGEKDAPVKIVEFGDFKCPSCAMWEKTVFPQIYTDYVHTGKVQFYFINWQFLDVDSVLAGVAGEALYHQNPDAFWQFYSKIYENQGPESKKWATEKFLLGFVKDNITGIDYKQFEKDLKERKYMDLVRKDFLIGQKYGVGGTPAIYVNGKQVKDNSYEEIRNAIENAMGEKK